jgi:hypothetical protein
VTAVASVSLALPAAVRADEVVFAVADSSLTAVTGLTRDTANDLYWLAQPSAEGAERSTVYGVDASGQVLTRLSFPVATPGLSAASWFGDVLYLVDTSEVTAATEVPGAITPAGPAVTGAEVSLYGLPTAAVGGDREGLYTAYTLVYPDGPHDASALLVNPDGQIFLVTTGPVGGLYAVPRDFTADAPVPLERVGQLPGGVTDGLFLSDRLIALRTDDTVIVIDASTLEEVRQGPIEQPGQSLTLGLDGTELMAARDGQPVTVAAVPVPARTAINQAETLDSQGRRVSQAGTLIMLGAAVGLALIGGVLVFLRR